MWGRGRGCCSIIVKAEGTDKTNKRGERELGNLGGGILNVGREVGWGEGK